MNSAYHKSWLDTPLSSIIRWIDIHINSSMIGQEGFDVMHLNIFHCSSYYNANCNMIVNLNANLAFYFIDNFYILY